MLQKEDVQLGEVWRRWDSKWQPGMPETNKVPAIGGWVREWSRIVERRGVLYRQIEDKVHSALFQNVNTCQITEGAHDNWGHQGTPYISIVAFPLFLARNLSTGTRLRAQLF